MEQNKGKPVTTSVPSIAIKFHANAEQLEEVYPASDEEHSTNDLSTTSASISASDRCDSDSSPLKYLPRLVKRSTSIDITPVSKPHPDASPPSDPWRFFSDIRGKITRSVEDKITEIKARNQEEGSPSKKPDNSSVSDSEDMSESSISKTCGIVSTTEGAEMSTDEDTPSIEKDKKSEPVGLRHRFRLVTGAKSSTEGTVATSNLAKLYNINTERVEQALPEDDEVESGVDALADMQSEHKKELENRVIRNVANRFDNIRVDDENVVSVGEVKGSYLREATPPHHGVITVFAPVGFVDLRRKVTPQSNAYLPFFMVATSLVFYVLVQAYSNYFAGFLVGLVVAMIGVKIRSFFTTPSSHSFQMPKISQIVQIPAVKEHQPLSKYEGWVNELPDLYDPHFYHISQTQSVFLRLQGNLLRVSHTRSKIPKRAMWNEPKLRPTFTHHRVYNLIGAKVSLLPEGLAKKRYWSKKYPICVTLNKDQLNFEVPGASSTPQKKGTPKSGGNGQSKGKRIGFNKKKYTTQRFSKLSEDEQEFELESETSRASTPSHPSPDFSDEQRAMVEELQEELDANLAEIDEQPDPDLDVPLDDWSTFTPDESPTDTKLYFFGRTDREKEDWFRKFAAATHKGANIPHNEILGAKESVSDTLLSNALCENDYLKFMLMFNKSSRRPKLDLDNEKESPSPEEPPSPPSEDILCDNIVWINAFVGRILFDCLRDATFTERVKTRIQSKLGTIKLPYFIEELLVTELSLGQTPVFIHNASKPVIDERGLWVDLDVSYHGLVVLTIETKLNLMRLKHPPPNVDKNRIGEKVSAMFNSDVEDSAESTSDDEAFTHLMQQNASQVLDASGLPVASSGGTSNSSKKFIKMVDRIAESKFFQAATENRYIKKAMEGVSNTDLRLKVEVRELVGTLVLNIPAPPSDRVWIGFRPTPELALSAHPVVGERNITFLRVTGWIEKKLLLEFQKLLVIPNMEDFVLPVMSQKLPD